MSTVTVSSKFQIVIPDKVRKRLGIMPKQKLLLLEKDGTLHLVPLKPIKETRGFVKGLDTRDLREEGDRF
ncbi:MAG: AbrB/MazE/SpoVT family DNA-binding domain-containing protein [Candidatus Verstraetearchaeota archaeon]|nr:AbrB/MazE/SpoVT family DNA-binding domain-containing protein [Candidatus Verstraetearchaeota archaeon]